MQKIRNIEFLRIVGCLAVVMWHLCHCVHSLHTVADTHFYNSLYKISSKDMLAVDLFFIISGFFFMYKNNFEKPLINFLQKKLLRVYPLFVVVLFLSWLISKFHIYEFNYYQGILNLFCINGTSLSLTLGLYPEINIFWYVSAMLWVFALYYYLYQNLGSKYVDLILALLVYFSYSILIHFTWANWETIGCFINSGMLRAMGGIGLGCFIAKWYRNNKSIIKNQKITFGYKMFISILEFMCLFFIINNFFFRKLDFENNFIFVLVFVLIMVLFLINQGFISKFFNKDIFVNLAKYTYAIYISHGLVILCLWSTVWKKYNMYLIQFPVWNFILSLCLIFTIGIFMHKCIEVPLNKYLSIKMQQGKDLQ